MTYTPKQRRMRAQRAAHIRWSREDPTANVLRAQAGLLARFEREVDPNNELAPAERRRRAESLHKAHMLGLALHSAKKRAARRVPLDGEDGGAAT